MKKIFVTILMLLAVSAVAQGMNQQDMMAQIQEMSACIESVDQNELKVLEKDATKFEAEMKVLCKDGKRDDAQDRAVVFSKKMMNSSILKTMRKCTEKMSASMKKMMPDMGPDEIAKDFSNSHVCDEI